MASRVYETFDAAYTSLPFRVLGGAAPPKADARQTLLPMEGLTYDDTIPALLQEHGPLTAGDLVRRLGWSKQEVNRALYALKDQGQLSATHEFPPRWRVNKPIGEKPKVEGEDQVHVYIDLDNVHDCFERASYYVRHGGNVFVHGFSGPVYNHWKPVVSTIPGLTYHTLNQQFKDIAELALFMHVLQDVEQNDGKGTYLLVSKDKSVYTMCELLKPKLHKTAEIQCLFNWDQLKLHLI